MRAFLELVNDVDGCGEPLRHLGVSAPQMHRYL